jgi:hypothetical protein
VLGASELLKLNGETEKKLLSLIGELDRAASEEYRRFDLRAFREELFRMLQFELEVMFVGVRTETYLLYNYLGGVLLHLLGFLPLLIEILLVIQNLTYRRISLVAYLNKIQFKFVSQLYGIGD